MSLSYPQQRSYPVAGTKNINSNAVTATTLTTSYAGVTKKIACDYASQSILYVQYTPGAGGGGNIINIKIEGSPDSVNSYQESVESATTAGITQYLNERVLTGAVALTTYTLRIPIELADRFVKISFKETVSGGSAGIVFAELLVSGK